MGRWKIITWNGCLIRSSITALMNYFKYIKCYNEHDTYKIVKHTKQFKTKLAFKLIILFSFLLHVCF